MTLAFVTKRPTVKAARIPRRAHTGLFVFGMKMKSPKRKLQSLNFERFSNKKSSPKIFFIHAPHMTSANNTPPILGGEIHTRKCRLCGGLGGYIKCCMRHASKTSAGNLRFLIKLPQATERDLRRARFNRKVQACESEISGRLASRTASRYSF